jgi:hypothetical protein
LYIDFKSSLWLRNPSFTASVSLFIVNWLNLNYIMQVMRYQSADTNSPMVI